MKVVQINTYNYGSTGNIMLGVDDIAMQSGIISYTACCDSRSNRRNVKKSNILFSSIIEHNLHIVLDLLTGYNGVFSSYGTKKLIDEIKKIKPDIIHFHNLHNCYINLPMIFKYVKENSIPVVWTLHDCWSFTGQCPHFTMIKCYRWKTGCYCCPQYRSYPASFIDRTKTMWRLKKSWFTGVKNMNIVTPTKWLAELVQESFLMDYPVCVINNGIDLQVFKPTPSSFREKYGLQDKHFVLGVAFGWGRRKGLDAFIEISGRLGKEYQIVLVGTEDSVDKQLPESIISIHRTLNQTELAEIYTAADVFVNPTREEVFGLVNIEALACGTPVITFDAGGSPECIDETCGSVVDVDDNASLLDEIKRICQTKPYTAAACMRRAAKFEKDLKLGEYIELYHKIVEELR